MSQFPLDGPSKTSKSPPVAHVLAELYMLGVDVSVDGDQVRCDPKGVLTPDLAARIADLKPDIIARLKVQEDEISWRAGVMLASDPPVFSILNLEPVAGHCSSCGDLQPYDQDGKCVLCALAAVRVSRIVDGLDGYPDA